MNLASVYGDTTFNGHVDHKTGFRTHNLLCFPLRNTQTRRIFGVIEVLNKRRGSVSFDANDEAFMHVHAHSVAYLLQHYPVDYMASCYDPAPVHAVMPLQLASSRSTLIPMESTLPRQLVYRSSTSGNIRRHKVTTGAEAGKQVVSSPCTLMEVDDYINHMEESWRKAVLLNMEQERETTSLSQRVHSLHDEAIVNRQLITDLRTKLSEVQRDNSALKALVNQLRGGGTVGSEKNSASRLEGSSGLLEIMGTADHNNCSLAYSNSQIPSLPQLPRLMHNEK
jgi:hypothetical protein